MVLWFIGDFVMDDSYVIVSCFARIGVMGGYLFVIDWVLFGDYYYWLTSYYCHYLSINFVIIT